MGFEARFEEECEEEWGISLKEEEKECEGEMEIETLRENGNVNVNVSCLRKKEGSTMVKRLKLRGNV